MATEIVDYAPTHAEAFKQINMEWIQEMFAVEPADLEALDHPQAILDQGGAILMALLDGVPVGTGALNRTGPGEFELTKMGVLGTARGHGLGKSLLEALVAKAQAMGATKLYLLTNWACESAIGLYLRHGFVHDAQILEFYGPKYARAEVGMSYPV